MISDPGRRPRLLMIGSGDRRYREYILAAVSAHCDLWLLDAHEVTWQAAYVAGSATVPGIREPQELAAAARQVTGQWPADGVFCYDETLVHVAAQTAEALGLPGSPACAVLACRDKALTRSVLAAAGIPQPASTAVRSRDEALAAAGATGYPVVIKARGLAGSIGVVMAEGPAAVAAAFAAASSATFPGAPGYDAGVLVEEYLPGPEISVDCVVADGACTITTLARKQTGLEPFFEETGHTVDARDPLLDDAVLRDQLDRVHKALEYTRGATHTEFRLTPAGPRLVEINARLGGDLIPYLGFLATGADPCVAAAQVAAGRVPDTAPRHRKTAGIRFLYPPQDCEVVSAAVRHDRLGPGIHRAVATAAPGTRLALPPRGYLSRYGYVIAVGDDPAQVDADLADPASLFDLQSRPLPG
jgi:biotin carboxylase